MNLDDKEVSEMARSIASLFGAEAELESAAALGSSEEGRHPEERHPDVGVALGLEDALDAPAAEPELPLTPSIGSEPEMVDPVVPPAEPFEVDAEAEELPLIDMEDALAVTEPELGATEAELGATDPELGTPEPEVSTPEPVPPAPELAARMSGSEPPAREPALSETGRALGEATSLYLEAPTHERAGAGQAVRAAAEASRAAGALDEIAVNVNSLLLGAAGDADVEELASELMEAGVLAGMVARLGSVRDVEEREGLIKAYLKMGDSVAEAIADALTGTDDRLARSTYIEALGAFGDTGLKAAEKMVLDSRWFVVRNGVSVISVAGGPNAIEPLTSCLAHEHPGVRQESLRSLAKIGGENAGLLVSSMLGDSDPKVRAAAARAIAGLKVEKSYRQLIEILKEGDEDAVIEEVLRALGALGDASAVSVIEKRMKGSLFKRPSKGIQLAGLAALAAIGTPRAMSLINKATSHKDPEISALAAQLLRK